MESFSFSIPGGEGALSLAVADAHQSAGLSRARHHILVADLPYGVQHAPSGKGSLQALMEQFRQCGLHFSLDDFGSKYANMQIFTGVKFDTVKLDRSLIAGMVGNSISQMLVQDIVRICRTCGMACIAEGVETQEQAAALEKMGCRCAQGYYFDRPLPAEQFERKYLQRQGLARQS